MNRRALEERIGGRRAAVVGIGNRLRGDDGAGSLVAERLIAGGSAPVFDAETVPENFLGALIDAAPEVVLFVDAADHGAAPGACCVVPVDDLVARAPSTHLPSLAPLARILASEGIACWLLGIQPGPPAVGTGLSPTVEAAVREVAEAVAPLLPKEARGA